MFIPPKKQSASIRRILLFKLTLEVDGAVPVVLSLAKTPWSLVDDGAAVITSNANGEDLASWVSVLHSMVSSKEVEAVDSAEAVLRRK